MTQYLTQKLKMAGVAASAFLVASCGPLISFGDDGPADSIYTLHYGGIVGADSPVGPVVYVDSPQMAEGLDGQGVSVRLDGNQRTTLTGAGWAAHLSDLVRDYVTLALGATSNANMIGVGGLDIKAGCRLGIKVWAMEFVPGLISSEDTVDVAMQFSLVRLSDSKLLSHPTFSQTVNVQSSGGRGIVAAFDAAMAAAARDYSRWFKVESKACETT